MSPVLRSKEGVNFWAGNRSTCNGRRWLRKAKRKISWFDPLHLGDVNFFLLVIYFLVKLMRYCVLINHVHRSKSSVCHDWKAFKLCEIFRACR